MARCKEGPMETVKVQNLKKTVNQAVTVVARVAMKTPT